MTKGCSCHYNGGMGIIRCGVLIAAVIALLVAACTDPEPAPTLVDTPTPAATHTPVPTPPDIPTATPTTIPTATPTTIPTATPTARPIPTHTPIATLQPTPVRDVTSNLVPFTPPGWTLPLTAADEPGLQRATELSVDGETYISWAATNRSSGDIDYFFLIDLYLDGVLIERWQSGGLKADQTIEFTDWAGLGKRVRLKAGVHTLKLVIDATGLVPEIDESDNVFEREFTWAPSTVGASPQTPMPSKLPDLVPYAPADWADAIIATSYSGDVVDGPLSVDVPTYIRFGFRNQGLASIPQDIWVYLYLDDILVIAQVGSGLIAEETAGSEEWPGLLEVVNVTPGRHTIKLEVDATDLVSESDEMNNVMEKSFTWATGAVQPKPFAMPSTAPIPTAPAPQSLPNLVPGWRMEWDGPIVISHPSDTFVDGSLTIDSQPFIDMVTHNQSTVQAGPAFSIDLYFDDMKVHTSESSGGMKPNELLWFNDWSDLLDRVDVAKGTHTLRMVIDPDDAVQEANESDNVFEKEFYWDKGSVALPTPITYTEQELSAKLSDLQSFLDTREPAIDSGGEDYTPMVLEVAEAGYYLLTGRSLQDERVNIFVLPHQEFLEWIDDHYAERFALRQVEEHPSLLVERERTKRRGAGFKTGRFGKVAIVVNGELNIADVIGSLAHELGHMRQEILNPKQDSASGAFYRKAMQEAQAQQFERAFWLKLESFTDLPLLSYPDYPGFRQLVDRQFLFWFANWERDEHHLGAVLQWLAVLDDPALTHLNGESLALESSLELFRYLAAIPTEEVEHYVNSRLQSLKSNFELMRAVAKNRLSPALSPDDEGSPDLRHASLLIP